MAKKKAKYEDIKTSWMSSTRSNGNYSSSKGRPTYDQIRQNWMDEHGYDENMMFGIVNEENRTRELYKRYHEAHPEEYMAPDYTQSASVATSTGISAPLRTSAEAQTAPMYASSARIQGQMISDRVSARERYNQYIKDMMPSLEAKRGVDDVTQAKDRLSKLDRATQNALSEVIDSTGSLFQDTEKMAQRIADQNRWDEDTLLSFINDAYTAKHGTQMSNSTNTMTPEEKLMYSKGKILELDGDERDMFNSRIKALQSISDLQRDSSGIYQGGPVMMGRGSSNMFNVSDLSLERSWDADKAALKKKGWSDDKIAEYEDYAQRIANSQSEDDFSKKLNANSAFDAINNTMYALDPRNAVTGGIKGLVGTWNTNSASGLGTDVSNPWLNAQRSSEYAQGQVTQNVIGDEHPILQGVYSAGMSTAQAAENIMASAVLGAAGVGANAAKAASLIPFFAQATNSGYLDAKERGLSENDAQMYGIATGAAEAGTEIVSLDHLWDMAKGTKVGKNLVIDWLAQAGIEGSEEAASDIANRVSDYMIAGRSGKSAFDIDKQEYLSENPNATEEDAIKYAEGKFWKQVGEDALAGMFSGAILGAGGVAVGVSNAKANKAEGSKIQSEFNQRIADENFSQYSKEDAEKYAKNPIQYMADHVDDSTQEGKKIKADIQEIANKESRGEKISMSDRAYIQQYAPSIDVELKNNEEDLVPEEYRGQKNSMSFDDAYREMVSAAQKGDTTRMGEVYEMAKNSTSTDTSSNADSLLSNQIVGMALTNGATREGINSIRMTKGDAYMNGLIGNENAPVDVRNKEAYNAGRMQFLEDQKSLFYKQSPKAIEEVDSIASEQDTKNGQVKFKEFIREGDAIKTYQGAWKAFYEGGMSGLSYSAIAKENSGYVSQIGEGRLKAMFKEGQKEKVRLAKAEVKENAIKALSVQFKGSGEFVNDTNNADSDYAIMDSMAKVLGVDIVLSKNQAMFKSGENARFIQNQSAIYVNANNPGSAIHEIAEFTQAYNSEGYNHVRDAVLKVMEETMGAKEFSAWRQAYKDSYAQVGQKRTDFDITSEMVNDALVPIMLSDKGRNALVKYATNNLSDAQQNDFKSKVKSLYKKLVNSIDKLLGETNLTEYQKKALQGKKEDLQNAADLFVKAMEGARQNYQKAKEIGKGDSEVRHSIGIDDSVFMSSEGDKLNGYEVLDTIEQKRIEDDVKSFRNGDKSKLTSTSKKKKVLRVKGSDASYNKVVVLDQWNYGIRVSKVYELKDDYFLDKEAVSEAIIKGEKNGNIQVVKEIAENVCGRGCIVEYILDTHKTNADAFIGKSRRESKETDRNNQSEKDGRSGFEGSKEAKAYSLVVDSDGFYQFDNDALNEEESTKVFFQQEASKGDPYIYIRNAKYVQNDTWKALANIMYGDSNKWAYLKKEATNETSSRGYGIDQYFTADILSYLSGKSVSKNSYADREIHAEEAEKYFKTTSSFEKAGYLDINGKLLDFSEGQRYRTQDHREISQILDLPDDAGYSDGLIQFMSEGNIRMQSYGIDISVAPNDAQISVLKKFFRSLNGEVSVDFSKVNGDTAGNAEYIEGTDPARIINDINNYFATGNVPSGNSDSVLAFHYSMNVDSLGTELSEDQKKYFEGTTVVDADGRLQLVYHGTPSGGFTVFKNDLNFYTPNREYAERYTNPSASSRVSGKQDGSSQIYEGYLKIRKPFDLSDPKTKEIFINEYVKGGYALGINPYLSDAEIQKQIEAGIDWAEADNIKEFIDDKGYDYDGIVLNEGGDITDNGTVMRGVSYVTFNSNQFKNADNLNPTENDDINYSMDVDPAFLAMMDWEQTPEYTELGSILEEGMKKLKGANVNQTTVKKIATQIKSDMASTIGTDRLTEMLTNAFAYMQSQENINYNDMMRIMAEIATPVVEQSSNKAGQEVYDEFVNALKGYKIKLNDVQKQEVINTFGSYEAFKKAMRPLTFNLDGSDLDSNWADMVEATGGILDYDISDADQPIALYDTLTSLKPTVVNNFEGNEEEVARDLAMRIVEDYLRSSEQSAYAEEVKRIKTEVRKKISDSYKERLKEAKEKIKADAMHRVKNAQYEERWAIAELKAKNRKEMSEYKERREALRQKNMIGKAAKKLLTWVSNPTEEHHVPKDLMQPVMDFLYAMDFVEPAVKIRDDGKYEIRVYDPEHSIVKGDTRSMVWQTIVADTRQEAIAKFHEALNAGMGSRSQRTWRERMRGLQDLLQKVQSGNQFEGDMSNLMELIDPELADEFTEMLNQNNGVANINSLSSEDLKVINKVIRGITHAINVGNQMLTQKAQIDQLAAETIENAKSLKQKNHTKFFNKLTKNLVIDMATPDTFFALQGKAGETIYKSFMNALDRKISDIKKATEYMEDAMKSIGISQKDVRKLTGDRAEIHSFQVRDGRIDLSIAQIMSLYELNKRQQAVFHYAGGVEASTLTVKERGIRKEQTQTKAVHLTADDLGKIFSVLTEEQKSLADMMQKFLATDCAKWGNEAAMMLYGYEKYTDPNYFPIHTDKTTNAINNQSVTREMLNGIERMGFTKQVKPNATNPIVIEDIFEVFTQHVTDMAAYHSYAPAVKDSNRWFNFKTQEDVGDGFLQYTTVQQAVNTNVGRSDNQGVEYYTKLIKDINGSERSGEIETFWGSLIGNYKAAAVAGNLRVVIQQPTAFVRAANVLDFKHMISSLPKALVAPQNMKRIKDICPIAWWKSQGYYETSMGKSVKEILTGDATIKDRIIDKSMWLAGKADDITWSILYSATEKQVRTENKNIPEEEFRKKVNDLFNQVISQTQVVDATIMKSQWMRAKGGIAKLQTAFMSEPTKSYNMAMKAMLQDQREHGYNPIKWKTTRKAVAVLAITDALNSLAQAIIDGLRYKDDDDYWDTVLNYFEQNMIDNINPLNRIPGLKDLSDSIISAFKGESQYGSSSGQTFDASSAEAFIDAIATTSKLIQGSYNKTGYAAYMTYAKAMSYATGIPLYNVSRDGSALWNLISDDSMKLRKTVETPSEKYNSIFNALDKEKSDEDLQAAVDKAISKGGTVNEVESKIKNKYKEDYLAAFEEGDTEAMADYEKVITRGFRSIGLGEDAVQETIDQWTTDKIEYSDLDNAIMNGQGISETVNALKEAGKKDDAILTHIVDKFGSTIDYSNDREIQSDLEQNVNVAMKAVNPEWEYGVTETVNQKKNNLFNAIDEGDLNKCKDVLKGIITDADSLSTVKSAITSQYKAKYIELYNTDRGEANKLRQRIASVKAAADEIGKFKGNKNKSYNEYELAQIDKWIEDK